MSIYPAGKLHKMQAQMFRNAQVDQMSSDLPVNSSGMDMGKIDSPPSIKETVKDELTKNFGIEERKLNSKTGWYSEKTDHESNETSGYFLVPTYSGDKKFDKSNLMNLISRLKKMFSNLQFSSELSGDNYKVIFKSIKKEAESVDSFDSLPGISKSASNTTDIFMELLNQRKDILYKKLRGIE